MRKNAATSSDRSSSPASQTRPKLAATRPAPIDDPIPDTHAAIDAARLADDYDAIRIKLAEFETEKKGIETKLIAAMKASGKKNFNTMHGRVSFLPATDGKVVPDEKAAVALLERHGISQPPTLAEWIARHSTEERPLKMPTTTKAGMPARIQFEMNK